MVNYTIQIIIPDAASQGQSIEAEFQIGTEKHHLFFRSHNTVLSRNLESFLASTILPCMKSGGGSLSAEGDISPLFISALSTIQDIFCVWDATLHRVEIAHARPVARSFATRNRVGTFFSGGVDSFYTLLKHQEEITDIIFVHGFDIRLDDTALREKTASKIYEVASIFDKNVIEIETNIRELLDHYVKWGASGHGAALAATGHLLAQEFSRIFIPGSYTYSELFPWGTHPVLDYLWSSENLAFVHDGCEATRVEKVALISKHDIALQSLRVCWENPDSTYNCGRCEKCLRTMINLKVHGALSRCTTFDTELDLKHVLKLEADSESVRAFVRQNLQALEAQTGNDELRHALHQILNRPQWPRKIKRKLKGLIAG